MDTCCFTMSVFTALFVGFLTGMITNNIMTKKKTENKFPPAPVLAHTA